MPLLVPLVLLLAVYQCHGLASVSTKPHILSVGLAAVDFVATVDHFPDPDEKMRSSSLFIEGGGNAANTACAIGRLSPFADVSIVTAVGDDANGNTIVDGLTAMNVNIDHVDHYDGSSPFSYILSTDIDGENTRTCIHQPSTGDMSTDFVEKIPLEKYTAAHFDVRYPTAAVALSRRCVEADVPYSVDVERPREGLDELLQEATVVICNSNYCDTILGNDEKETDTAQRLRKVIRQQAPKAKLAVQTLGGKGSCLIRLLDDSTEEQDRLILQDEKDSNAPVVTLKDGALFCTAFSGCKVVDTTGAGDAFQGGFITALWANAASKRGKSPEVPTDSRFLAHALRIATRVAAKKVEKPGARSGLPDAMEDEFIQSEMEAMLDLAPTRS